MDKTKVKDLMTKSEALVKVGLEDRIDMVANLMVEKDVGSVLVYDENKPFGIITKRDILTRVIINCDDPCEVKARDIASKDLITISPNKTIKEALMVMYKHKIRRVPVKDPESTQLVGIITTHDFIAAYNYLDLSTSKN